MACYSGRYYRGASKDIRAAKRAEAERRNDPARRLINEVFGDND